MAVQPLCVAPHPALRMKTTRVESFTKETQWLARDLIDTMYAHDGIGLAAPQIGRNVELFVANPSQERGRELVIANPVFDDVRGRAAVVEGCLSVPKVWERVKRAAHVRLSGQDVHGQPVTVEAEGLLAIVLQHEVDHLHGRLFIDRLSWFRRRRLHMRKKHLE